jgi:hypothetical protein
LRKTGLILLLLLIGYAQWGYQLQFLIEQAQMKEAAREAWIASLPDHSFRRISLTAIQADGKLQDAGRECWYQGHLYDVIRQRREGSTTWLYCLDDKNEEQLIRHSDEVTKTNLDHPDTRAGHSLTLSFGDLICETPNWPVVPPPVNTSQFSTGSGHPLPVCYPDILIPPPRA